MPLIAIVAARTLVKTVKIIKLATLSKIPKIRAFDLLILSPATGLLEVLFIVLSISLSMEWLIAPAPPEAKVPPTITASKTCMLGKFSLARNIADKAVITRRRFTLGLVKVV